MKKDKKVTVPAIMSMKESGQKIAALTAYDATFAAIEDSAGMDLILVGDSAGMVIAGDGDTIPLTLDEIINMTRYVRRGVKNALLVADMTFGSFQVSQEETIKSAIRLMKEGGAEAVKLEGAGENLSAIKRMTDSGIPVMGHLGLTPQSVHAFGGYGLRGKAAEEAEKIKNDAVELEKAGVFSIVLEKIPSPLAKEVTELLKIPTVGIGSGPDCDGQILVSYDMLGLTPMNLKFVRKYMDGRQLIMDAVKEYVRDIKDSSFPDSNESFF